MSSKYQVKSLWWCGKSCVMIEQPSANCNLDEINNFLLRGGCWPRAPQ
jgi:hypothetical protein